MAPAPRSFVIATAGHIDHGKTTLVRALTGIDADRLPEEKRRGITIDLGFASMELHAAGGTPIQISFVDVPGHSLFIRNMLAGAGCVPAVMLIVAADEGIKPQTIEHLAICELLGITQGVTVVTKIDAVTKEHLDQVLGNIRGFLRNTFLDGIRARILPVSAQTGEGLEGLRTELLDLAVVTQAARSEAPLRLPLDRAFVMKGFGTVVTGTLLSGSLHEGQSLILEPGGRSVRVRGLQTHGRPETAAHAGTRVAVNLAGVDVAEVHRGQAIVASHSLGAVDLIDAEIRLLPSAPPLKHRARVHFHAFTSETMAGVSVFGYEAVHPGTARIVRLKLDEPVVLAPGDRFVLRHPAPVATIGGGRVLDCHPEARRRKTDTLAWLEELNRAPLPHQLELRVRRRGVAGIRLDALAREAGLTLDATHRYLDPMIEKGDIVRVSAELHASRAALDSAANKVLAALRALAQTPASSGIKSAQLRGQASLSREIFDFVIAGLARVQKIRIQGENFSLAGQATSSLESGRLAALAQTYEAAGLAAPTVPELAQRFRLTEPEMRRLITLLQRQKTIVRMGSDDLFMHARAVDGLIAKMAPLRGTLLDVAGFKQLTGLSRKYAIPLLEYLDHARITRKQGDRRLVL
jgi:selenocysteine-specific elongation factor